MKLKNKNNTRIVNVDKKKKAKLTFYVVNMV